MDTAISEESYGLYVNFMRVNCVINTIMMALILFLIICHTPTKMATYKWYLMNMALSCYALDLFNDLFFLPVTIFPIIGACTLGLLKPFNTYATSFMQYFLGFCAASQTYAVIYRTASVYDKLHVLGRKSSIFLLLFIQLSYSIPAVIATLLTFPGHEKSVDYIKENYPLMLDFFLTHSCTILGTEVSKIIPYIVTALTLIWGVVMANMVAVTMAIRGLRAARGKMTQKTYRMHRQLTLSVVLQTIIPTGMVTASYVTLVIACVMQLDSARTISFVAFVISTFHTTVLGLLMIFIIRPYKLALLTYIRRLMPIREPREDPNRRANRMVSPAKTNTLTAVHQVKERPGTVSQ
ncbi:serpentine type 7TM GPCR chemoreceptor srh domain-containing protein [Ditylenchus destructor]|uniref:Serpentine type 7TM GPCR chemoreceptor srh domain-containing protein n=1 Tax=Ditylenchus destructor TaxID=166010 RepID=A0AAD4QTS8_9BILA|nr:serpentine type 7TM GPCR chemoreceptor srh domain-containing protein [Ditylenchus destructor]